MAVERRESARRGDARWSSAQHDVFVSRRSPHVGRCATDRGSVMTLFLSGVAGRSVRAYFAVVEAAPPWVRLLLLILHWGLSQGRSGLRARSGRGCGRAPWELCAYRLDAAQREKCVASRLAATNCRARCRLAQGSRASAAHHPQPTIARPTRARAFTSQEKRQTPFASQLAQFERWRCRRYTCGPTSTQSVLPDHRVSETVFFQNPPCLSTRPICSGDCDFVARSAPSHGGGALAWFLQREPVLRADASGL